eukprot:TRINITY_DN7771_c0_g1_i1.p1 TRINITY_DN7771_c0_g1~~TRINITY_DN7771_c0_g1_i1.p1  ORF type:complete len:282 (-),score=50.63 TRINITY_DN7771_c0_g1_i1:263-1108(-)
MGAGGSVASKIKAAGDEAYKEIAAELETLEADVKKGMREFKTTIGSGIKSVEHFEKSVLTAIDHALGMLATMVADIGLKDSVTIDASVSLFGTTKAISCPLSKVIDKTSNPTDNDKFKKLAQSILSKASNSTVCQAGEKVLAQYDAPIEDEASGTDASKLFKYVQHLLGQSISTSLIESILKSMVSMLSIASSANFQEKVSVAFAGMTTLGVSINIAVDVDTWLTALESSVGEAVSAEIQKVCGGAESTDGNAQKTDSKEESKNDNTEKTAEAGESGTAGS